jgi:hypothetical protein
MQSLLMQAISLQTGITPMASAEVALAMQNAELPPVPIVLHGDRHWRETASAMESVAKPAISFAGTLAPEAP